MSEAVPYEKMPPPSYNEAVSKNEVPKEEAAHSSSSGAALPAVLAMPVPLRDVGRGNVVYIVNEPRLPGMEGDDGTFGSSFGSKAIRAAFVRKVYTILMIQLLVTFTFIAWFLFHEGTRHFVRRNIGILIAAYVVFLVTYMILICCPSVRRSWPANIIMLSVFTLSKSYWAAAISAYHDTALVIMTVGIVAVLCLGISLFSIQTKWDITGAGLYLFALFMVVFVFGIIAIIVTQTTGTRFMIVAYAGLLALIFALYLVYDTQQIIGGRKVEISPEEHIYGALQLYIDIINLYLILLSVNSSCK